MHTSVKGINITISRGQVHVHVYGNLELQQNTHRDFRCLDVALRAIWKQDDVSAVSRWGSLTPLRDSRQAELMLRVAGPVACNGVSEYQISKPSCLFGMSQSWKMLVHAWASH